MTQKMSAIEKKMSELFADGEIQLVSSGRRGEYHLRIVDSGMLMVAPLSSPYARKEPAIFRFRPNQEIIDKVMQVMLNPRDRNYHGIWDAEGEYFREKTIPGPGKSAGQEDN